MKKLLLAAALVLPSVAGAFTTPIASGITFSEDTYELRDVARCMFSEKLVSTHQYVKTCGQYMVSIGVIDHGHYKGQMWKDAFKDYTFKDPTDPEVSLIKHKVGFKTKYSWRVKNVDFMTKHLSPSAMRRTLKDNNFKLDKNYKIQKIEG